MSIRSSRFFGLDLAEPIHRLHRTIEPVKTTSISGSVYRHHASCNRHACIRLDLGAYNGPDGSGIIELDFAFTFSRCTADFNTDGGVDGGDIAALFEVWESGGLGADFNADGGIDGVDVDAFFVRWEDGC